jgi:hypothetical protein
MDNVQKHNIKHINLKQINQHFSIGFSFQPSVGLNVLLPEPSLRAGSEKLA